VTIEPHDRTDHEQQPPVLPPPPHEQVRQQTQQRRGIFQRAGGAIVAGGLAVLKWGGVLLGLLGKTKLLGTMLSFFVSLAAYGYIFGWWFGLGFLILLLLHELGHVIQLRREGVPFSMPLFIPFMGAVVGMKGLPQNAWTEAKVGLAGPILGGIASAGCLLLAVTTNSDLLQALAYTGFFLNLFNLIPVLPLDGGRAAAALHPVFWFVGLFAVALLFFWHPNAILLFILILGGLELYSRWGSRHRPESRAYHAVTKGQRITIGIVYLALILALVAGMEISYLHRTF
jgi:Zn-dependent protease